MREAWSINALSLELGTDRRTITKWVSGTVGKFVFVSHTIPGSGEGGSYGEKSSEGLDRSSAG